MSFILGAFVPDEVGFVNIMSWESIIGKGSYSQNGLSSPCFKFDEEACRWSTTCQISPGWNARMQRKQQKIIFSKIELYWKGCKSTERLR